MRDGKERERGVGDEGKAERTRRETKRKRGKEEFESDCVRRRVAMRGRVVLPLFPSFFSSQVGVTRVQGGKLNKLV